MGVHYLFKSNRNYHFILQPTYCKSLGTNTSFSVPDPHDHGRGTVMLVNLACRRASVESQVAYLSAHRSVPQRVLNQLRWGRKRESAGVSASTIDSPRSFAALR
jgi:hypothetical protein